MVGARLGVRSERMVFMVLQIFVLNRTLTSLVMMAVPFSCSNRNHAPRTPVATGSIAMRAPYGEEMKQGGAVGKVKKGMDEIGEVVYLMDCSYSFGCGDQDISTVVPFRQHLMTPTAM